MCPLLYESTYLSPTRPLVSRFRRIGGNGLAIGLMIGLAGFCSGMSTGQQTTQPQNHGELQGYQWFACLSVHLFSFVGFNTVIACGTIAQLLFSLEQEMSQEIVQQWLGEIVSTVEAKDHVAHMNLISRRVSLVGVPGYENIGFDDWNRQVTHEFEDNIIQGIAYHGYKEVEADDRQITFKTFETVTANDGTVNAQGVEIMLEKEEDGQWRLVKERVLPALETAREQLSPG